MSIRSIRLASLSFLVLPPLLPPSVRAAQDPEPLPTAVVAVVDLTRVSDESLIGQDLAGQLNELQGALEDTLQDRRTRVQESRTTFEGMVDAFQAERDSLSEADARARENELVDRQQALQELIQAAQVDAEGARRRLQAEVARLTTQLDQEIRPHIQAVAEELGVDVLLPRSQVVFAKPVLDITDQVIARVDEAFPGN